VRVIGHRGARGLFPENTLEGFRAAAALGVAAFELDVGMTADGVVVVCHDPALNPDITRDAAGLWLTRPGPLLHSLSLAELARYDVGRIKPGSRTSMVFADQRPHDGARVPTLAAVLAALPDATFIIEVKTDPAHPERTADPDTLADAVLSVVDQAAAAERIVVEAFDWRVPRHVGRVRPAIRLAWLTRAETVRARALWWDDPGLADANLSRPAGSAPFPSTPASVAAAAGPAGGGIWAPDHADLTEAHVREAHALGLSVVPWTVNRRQDMDRLAGWKVDALISDRPDLALSLGRQ